MPMFLARWNPDCFASTYFPHRAAPSLHPANSRKNVKRLAKWMSMPSGPGSRLKAHPRRLDPRGSGGVDNRILPNRPSKPVRITLPRGIVSGKVDVHIRSLLRIENERWPHVIGGVKRQHELGYSSRSAGAPALDNRNPNIDKINLNIAA
jgi:hypothetical protein